MGQNRNGKPPKQNEKGEKRQLKRPATSPLNDETEKRTVNVGNKRSSDTVNNTDSCVSTRSSDSQQVHSPSVIYYPSMEYPPSTPYGVGQQPYAVSPSPSQHGGMIF